jgi:hypothetical protein
MNHIYFPLLLRHKSGFVFAAEALCGLLKGAFAPFGPTCFVTFGSTCFIFNYRLGAFGSSGEVYVEKCINRREK